MVRVHAGRYELTEPLIFKPEDSGTVQSPTIYVAAPGDEGRVVISGGRVVRAGSASAARAGSGSPTFPS